MRDYDREVDTSGLSCPMPVMRIKKALKELDPGQVLHVITTDPASAEDIPDFLHITGDQIVDRLEDGRTYHFFIKKRESSQRHGR